MKEFKVKDKTYNLPTSWSEVSLDMFIKIKNLEDTNQKEILGEFYIVRLLEILTEVDECGLDDMTLQELIDLINSVDFLNTQPEENAPEYLDINGIKYVFSKNFNQLTMSEIITIKTLQHGKTETESFLDVLCVILRPGVINDKGELVQDKLDISKLEEHKKLFSKQPVFDVLSRISFFLNGTK